MINCAECALAGTYVPANAHFLCFSRVNIEAAARNFSARRLFLLKVEGYSRYVVVEVMTEIFKVGF